MTIFFFLIRLRFFAFLFFICGQSLYASSSTDLPWEGPLQKVTASLQGPVATSLSVLALVGAACSLLFFEVGKGMRWFITVLAGASIIGVSTGLLSSLGIIQTMGF